MGSSIPKGGTQTVNSESRATTHGANPDNTGRGLMLKEKITIKQGTLDEPAALQVRDNWVTDTDPGFVDVPACDFRLRSDAPVFEHIPGKALPSGPGRLDTKRAYLPQETRTHLSPPSPRRPADLLANHGAEGTHAKGRVGVILDHPNGPAFY